jgi:hypothetical protein
MGRWLVCCQTITAEVGIRHIFIVVLSLVGSSHAECR